MDSELSGKGGKIERVATGGVGEEGLIFLKFRSIIEKIFFSGNYKTSHMSTMNRELRLGGCVFTVWSTW